MDAAAFASSWIRDEIVVDVDELARLWLDFGARNDDALTFLPPVRLVLPSREVLRLTELGNEVLLFLDPASAALDRPLPGAGGGGIWLISLVRSSKPRRDGNLVAVGMGSFVFGLLFIFSEVEGSIFSEFVDIPVAGIK